MSKLSAVISFFALLSMTAQAEYLSWNQLSKNFAKVGANPKAISHVQCFFERHEDELFTLKKPDNSSFDNRCYNKSEISLGLKRTFAIIDYTKPSNERRMYLVDRRTGAISTMAAAHGRFEADYLNRTLETNQNSVKWAKYFSNEPGSNAPSSGFFFAGHDYEGKFGRSLVLHGIEPGINDYACERAVVIHKHLLVSKNNAYIMSSGCPMVSRHYLDHVIQILRGKTDSAGGLVFIYGPREKAWETGACL